MIESALQLLKDVFGYAGFRGLQEEIVRAVLDGRDALVLMPTGGGKSLCYQLPALVRPGVGIVISPLIALMQDQVTALTELGVRAAFLNSTQHPDDAARVLDAVGAGKLELLYVAPERILKPSTLERLSRANVALIAIDEAHCVSQWGHDFRRDYLGLHTLAEVFENVPRIALTATADARTRDEIVERLGLTEPRRFVSGFDRPNIRYRVEPKTEPQRQLTAFLSDHAGDSGIVYCLSRRKVETVAAALAEAGHTALPYHAGLSADVRSRHQTRFLREEGVIIVATVAFGMGIDKPDVRFVAHLDLPRSIEAYYQETGRAGRDGEPAQAWMIYGLQDVVRLAQMVDQSDADDARKRIERGKLDALLGWCEVTTCRRQALLDYFDDKLEQPCGNCDICLNPPATWDGTVAAQMMLSCVLRTGQRFGVAHVIDVLRGKVTDKTRQHRHDQVSTWRIGAERTERSWRSVARQLLVRGFLRSDPGRFGALTVTAAARPLLKGAIRLDLREETPVPAGKRAGEGRARRAAALAPADAQLFDALRSCRKRLADQAGVPPYVVFHDAALEEMARRRPRSSSELLDVNGVGRTKLERYGEPFLAVIAGAGGDWALRPGPDVDREPAAGPSHDGSGP